MKSSRGRIVDAATVFTGVKKHYPKLITAFLTLAMIGFSVLGGFGIELKLTVASLMSVLTAALSYSQWGLYLSNNYNKVLLKPENVTIQNEYLAMTKTWNPLMLQKYILRFNHEHRSQWELEVRERLRWEDRPLFRKLIEKQRYRGSGINSARSLCGVLDSAKIRNNRYNLDGDRDYVLKKATSRVLITAFFMCVGASCMITGSQTSWYNALFGILVNLISMTLAIVSGALAGISRGEIKMTIVNDALTLLKRFAEKREEQKTLISQEPDDIVLDGTELFPQTHETDSCEQFTIEHLFNK